MVGIWGCHPLGLKLSFSVCWHRNAIPIKLISIVANSFDTNALVCLNITTNIFTNVNIEVQNCSPFSDFSYTCVVIQVCSVIIYFKILVIVTK